MGTTADVQQDTRPQTLRRAPALFQWGVFPLLMSGAVAAAWYSMHSGTEPAAAILLPQLVAMLLVALAERVYPYHESWLHSHSDIRVDATHTLGLGLVIAIATPFVIAAGVAIGGWLVLHVGIGLWPTEWPLPAQVALALVLGELPGYWVHRAQHHWDFLWRFHSVHHSAPRLYWLNAGRFHPVDILSTYIPSYLLLVILGCDEVILAYFALINAVHGIFQHSNLQLRCGPLNWIFSMAELHRWHHSRTLHESNSNYGQTISIWDWLFGTRFLPAQRQPPRDIGIATLPGFPMTWWAQIMAPLRWQRVKRESAAP